MVLMAEQLSFHMVVWGSVQGVGFREFVLQTALKLGVSGYVRNLQSHNAVEVVGEGLQDNLRLFTEYLREGPPASTVIKINLSWTRSSLGRKGFIRLD